MNDYSDIPYLRDLREELVRAAERHNTRRRRTFIVVRVAAVSVAVGAAAIVGLSVFGAGGAHTDSASAAILRRVATALAPPTGTILHERALVTIQGMAPARYELWQEADSPYSYRVIKFDHEASWNGSTLASYNSDTNTIVEQSGTPSSHPAYAPDDMAADLRALVQSGKARIEQETTFHGVPAYKLAVSGAPSRFLNGTVYVAKSDYHPLEIQTTLLIGGASERVDFQSYEYLPANSTNLKLLDLQAQHPGASVVNPAGTNPTTTTG